MLTESVCVTDKGAGGNPLAMKMAETLVRTARPGILKVYPVPLYEGENFREDARSSNVKAFPEPLTVELLKRHQALIPGRDGCHSGRGIRFPRPECVGKARFPMAVQKR